MVLAGIITLAVLGVTAAVPAFAADKTDTGTGSITGNVTINGSISPLIISVTHPINVAYAISPDAETFTSPDIKVTKTLPARCPSRWITASRSTGRTRPTISLFSSSNPHKDISAGIGRDFPAYSERRASI